MPHSASPSLAVQLGSVLAGKFRIDRVLGEGGMGVVVAAHHLALDERVALKFLLPHALQNAEAVSRFVREARAAVKIKSEHVARVIDVGELENGAPYMVMEYLDGVDLAGWLTQRGTVPVEQAVSFVLQACEALAEAHSLGIVHRDLKPGNLFCVQRPDGELSIKVLDFGISKLTAPGLPSNDLTRTSAVMGTPYYMSPEQMLASKDVDARSDIWAIGIILFELLTGGPPWRAEALTELAIKVSREPPPPLRAFLPDPPPRLEAVIQRCLEKDRANRYSNVAELVVALKEFGGKGARLSVERVLGTFNQAGMAMTALPDSAPKAAPRAGVAPTVASTDASWGQTSPVRGSARSKLWGGLGALVLVGGAAGLWAISGPVKEGPPAASRLPESLAPVPVQRDDSKAPAPPVAVPAPAPAPPVLSAAALTPSSVPVTPSERPRAEVGLKKRTESGTPPPSPPPPAPPIKPTAPVCTIVTTVDAKGQEHFKQECK